jgi:hypothetical protein
MKYANAAKGLRDYDKEGFFLVSFFFFLFSFAGTGAGAGTDISSF